MKFKKKPVTIDAVQWKGTMESLKDITDLYDPNRPWEGCIRNVDSNSPIDFDKKGMYLVIHTAEGIMEAPKGWFIIKGVEGEFYPCKPSVFFKTYEPVKQVKIVVYDDEMLENNELPPGVNVIPSAEGLIPTLPTGKGEEVVKDGDVIFYFPDGQIKKLNNEDVTFINDNVMAGGEVYSYEAKA